MQGVGVDKNLSAKGSGFWALKVHLRDLRMSYSLNRFRFKGGYIGDYIGEYIWEY